MKEAMNIPYTPTQTLNQSSTLRRKIHGYLVPTGAISTDYFAFQVFDTLQGCSSYLRSILATSSVLQVSTEPSTVVAYRWAFNHGVGMLVSLFLNSHVEFFSKDIRQSRVLADVLNDAALSVEMALPYVPVAWVAPLMLVATTMKCMCGFISGATRAAITAHFARDGNEADVAVKEGNQENLVTAAGLVMGGLFVRSVGSERSVIGAFAVLTYLHVVWNLAAVRQLRLRTLSFQRYHIAVALYFNNIRPTRSLVNKCEMFFYRRPKGAGGNGKVEDFWEGMEKNSDSDYYVSRDRLFFKRGARSAMAGDAVD
ncbi:hypothetical protein TrRE_jg4432 [Triparma retinervis]|uniref:Protein root UVB sensitive/RUS domain-containing protein n=1 Tax=Triparma retinervis TaxID=2557542 RepID=A0A9W7EHT9_9STRA|nr:hypothetical protein TrRE_jg4432 [Triparma retinervis]